MTTRRTVWVGRKPKLTPEQVRAVRAWAAFGTNKTAVARRLGITLTTLDTYLSGGHKRAWHDTDNDHRSIA